MAIRVFVLGILLCPSTYAASTHTLAKGDTYYSLSRKYGVSVTELQKANPTLNPSALQVGQIVQIPTDQATAPPTPAPTSATPNLPAPDSNPEPSIPAQPEFHVVSKGETLTRIATLRSTSVAELKALNNLKSSDIFIGQKLRVRSSSVSMEGKGSQEKDPEIPEPPAAPTAKATPTPSPTPSPTSTPTPQRYIFVTPARKQIDNVPKTERKWKFVVIHHSGTSTGNAKIFEYYHRRVRGMENGMAYHFVIGNGSDSKDGEIEVGNRWKQQLQGGHLRSEEQNEIAIGICLVGDFNRSRPTKKQIAALIELTSYLRQRQHPRELVFMVHRDINIRPTDCPGRLFPSQAMYNLFGKRK